MSGSLFDTLWSKHPRNWSPRVIDPCTTNGQLNFPDQCTIRLGVSLSMSGVSLASYSGAFCWSGHGRQHPLRVEEMKRWLNSGNATFVRRAGISKRNNQGIQKSHHAYLGVRGIVVFQNFWGPGGQGDHCDLWNGTELGLGDLNFFERSQEIWFWPM